MDANGQTLYLQVNVHILYYSAPHMHTLHCSTHTHAHFLLFHSAWTGRFCEEDIDGCSVVSCFEGVQCTDVEAPGTGATCGPCPAGYTGDGVKCSGRWHLLSKIRLVIHLTTSF